MGEEYGLGMIDSAIELASYAVDIGASLIMLLGFATAVLAFLRMRLRRSGSYAAMRDIRCTLGSHLALGLELMIVSDVLETVVSHSLDDLAYLGGLVVIRTLIAFFLGREIAETHEAATEAPSFTVSSVSKEKA